MTQAIENTYGEYAAVFIDSKPLMPEQQPSIEARKTAKCMDCKAWTGSCRKGKCGKLASTWACSEFEPR